MSTLQATAVASPHPGMGFRQFVALIAAIMAVNALGRPTARLEAGDLVVRDRQVGGTVDRDRIVIPENGELCQAQVTVRLLDRPPLDLAKKPVDLVSAEVRGAWLAHDAVLLIQRGSARGRHTGDRKPRR